MALSPQKIFAIAPTRLEFLAIEKVLKRYNCEGSISGIGPVETAHVLTRVIEAKRPNVVILCGLGGLYSSGHEFEPRVFLAETEILADLGRCTNEAISILEIEGKRLNKRFDLSRQWGLTLDKLLSKGFTTARMATVSCASGDRARALHIADLYDVEVENMEGASAALVCSHYNIGLFEFRAVSNIAGEIDHSKWKIDAALKRLGEEVDRFLGLLYT